MIDWIKNKLKPKQFKPQPCPFCNVAFGKAWIEIDKQGNEFFYVEHKEPLCAFFSDKHEIYLWTERERKIFRDWCKKWTL